MAISASRARRTAARVVVVLVAGMVAGATLLFAAHGPAARASATAGLPVPEPDLSLPAIPNFLANGGTDFALLGADPAGDAFAYTMEQTTQMALGSVGSRPVPSDWSDPSSNPTRSHFVLFARTASGGWHVSQEALDSTGAPMTGFVPAGYALGAVVPAGQVAPGGSAALAGTDTAAGLQGTQVVLVRSPGGRFQAAPAPPSSGPSQVLFSSETLFDSQNPALAAVDESGGGGVFIAPSTSTPGSPALGILHYDGTTWTREPISPVGSETVQRVLSISATSPTNAYLLALSNNAAAGIELFKREVGGSGPTWQPVTLSGSQGQLYAQQAPAGAGITALGPLHPEPASEGGFPNSLAAAGAQPLTATPSGVWVDGSFTDASGHAQLFTLNVAVTGSGTATQGAVHSWCNVAGAGTCDDPLPSGLPGGLYRSFAWASGGPYGARIITGMPGGSILSLQGTTFQLINGLGGEPKTTDGSAAFTSPAEGWTGGAPPTHFTTQPGPNQLQAWPAPFREPLTAIAGQPGMTPGALGAQAIAVGANGEVARYTPGQGWAPEPLLTAAGVRATPTLRGVAWPAGEFAYAVGDGGQMWRYDSATGFWSRDPATPYNFNGDLTAIAFDPANPSRGYAVGLAGVLLRFDKTWSQETLPAGLQNANFTSVTFAGSEAIAAFQGAQPVTSGGAPAPGGGPDSGLLINNGNGWQLDTQEQAITTPPTGGATPAAGSVTPAPPAVNIVSGLPDGGAVAAGDGVILERDSATAPWRLARDPLPGYSVVAAAAIRSGASVQALVSVDPIEFTGRWPYLPGVAPPACASSGSCQGNQGLPTILGPYDLPANGWLLRETATGWQDVQRNDYPVVQAVTRTAGVDNPARDDEVQALLMAPDGTQGWAVGGETGLAPNPTGPTSSSAAATPLHTAGIYRYPAATTPPTGASVSPPPLDGTKVTVALAGDAVCQAGCSGRDPRIGLGPPTWVDHAISAAQGLAGQPGGPRAFIYTGGILPGSYQALSPSSQAVSQELQYFAAHTQAAAGSLPFAPVLSTGEVFGGVPAPAFLHAFSAPPGVRGAFPDYYAFDVGQGGAGTLDVVVIDDATPSAIHALAARTSTDPQYQFLTGELASARAAHKAVIAIGARTLSTLSVINDPAPPGATAIAQLLVNGGVSAYFFDSPNTNTQYQIPAGAPQTIPSFGTGSLSYDAWSNAGNQFGESGYLLASVDAAHVDPATNRARINVQLVPNISELAIDALDGTVLRRSQVALFDALARRPRAGTGQVGVGNLVGPDPYIAIPPAPCIFACSARVAPEFTFTSSHPDIGNFVMHDPASRNLRAVYIGPDHKPIADQQSGLFCAFNAGTTTVTITTGGLSFSEKITVLGGQIRYPCGTAALVNPGVKFVPGPTPPAPAPLPATTPPPIQLAPVPPPPPAPAPAPAPHALTPTIRSPHVPPAAILPFVVRPPAPFSLQVVPLSPAPPAPPPSFPTGFSGVPVPISQPVVEERREEEHATEEAQNFSAYQAGQQQQILSPELAVALIVVLAGAGATLYRSRPRRRQAPAMAVVSQDQFRRGQTRRGGWR